MAENEEPEFRAAVISDAELDRFIADLGAHPLALDELRQVAEDFYVSLSQSQAAGFDYALPELGPALLLLLEG
jgi:hypothetical protein